MNEYILFLDTETSDIPRQWNAPASMVQKWPYILQISWLIYTSDGVLVKSENHYIRTGKIRINKHSQRLHGITNSMLEELGEERREVIGRLAADFIHYAPLVVGHFLEFDKKMLDVGFFRAGLENVLTSLKTFCTMRFSTSVQPSFTNKNGIRLSDLYANLFGDDQPQQHDALGDASATAKVFFELVNRGLIDGDVIEKQQHESLVNVAKKIQWPLILLFLLTGFVAFMLLGHYLN
jgi:DNA polymerase III subunit epsilon